MTTTTRTYIVLALGLPVVLAWDAWKNVSTDTALQHINIWLHRDMPMTKEWVYKFATLYATPLLMSLVCVIDSRGKEPVKQAMYWLWLIFFSFTFFKFLWDFDRDNYFFLYLPLVPLFFCIAAIIRHHSKYDIAYELRTFLRKVRGRRKYYNS